MRGKQGLEGSQISGVIRQASIRFLRRPAGQKRLVRASLIDTAAAFTTSLAVCFLTILPMLMERDE
jgi:hypothetical protein